jgi:hypothetical protein
MCTILQGWLDFFRTSLAKTAVAVCDLTRTPSRFPEENQALALPCAQVALESGG